MRMMNVIAWTHKDTVAIKLKGTDYSAFLGVRARLKKGLIAAVRKQSECALTASFSGADGSNVHVCTT